MKFNLGSKLISVWNERRRRNRLIQITNQMAQDLEVMASALRSGTSLIQAVQVTADEGKGALAEEWMFFLKDIRFGAGLEAALRDLQLRVPLPSMRSFATAVSITQTSGGNLAGVLLILAGTLRQEATFQGKLSAMTAQGVLSGYIVSAMPFFLTGALYILSPDLIRPFVHSGIGQIMMLLVIVLVVIGSWVIKKIVTIEV
jgi:tight adherence protein B